MKNTPQTYTVKNVDCHVYLFIACTTVKLQKLSPSALEAARLHSRWPKNTEYMKNSKVSFVVLTNYHEK